MGVSTNAYLAFGIDLGDELPESWLEVMEESDEEFNFEEFLQSKGIDVEKCPVHCVEHCSRSERHYFLYVPGKIYEANRGCPTEIPGDSKHCNASSSLTSLEIGVEEYNQFVLWCMENDILNIVDEINPVWVLFSDWN